MTVEVTRDGDSYLAVDSETDEYGTGATEAEALRDLDNHNRSLLDDLNEYGDDRLGVRMRQIKAILTARQAAREP